MILRLTRFELKKMLSGKFFLIVLALLLLANVLLHCGIQDYLLIKEAERNGTLIGGDAPANFWEQKVGDRRVTAWLRSDYAVFAALSPEELAAFENAMAKKYGDEVFDLLMPTPEMMALPGYFGRERSDFDAILSYATIYQMNRDIQELRDRTVRAAESFRQEATDAGDAYGIRRNEAIIRLYSVPLMRITTPVRGWREYLFESYTMCIVFLLVLLTCAGCAASERDGGVWLLLHTAKNGKGKTLAAKYLSGALTAVGLTVLFQLVTLGAVWFRGGLLGAGQSVAALEELRLCPYALTVWQYALVQLACQCFAAAVLSVLLVSVSALSKTGVIAYGAGMLVLGSAALLLIYPPQSKILAGPLALSQPLRFWGAYSTGNLFGYPILWAVLQTAFWIAICMLCAAAAHKISHRKRRIV